MNKIILPLILGLLGSAWVHASPDSEHCPSPSTNLRALYRYAITDTEGHEVTFARAISREAGRVTHEYLDLGIADSWTRTANARVAMVRYFDEAERALEYQPEDLPGAGNAARWSAVSNLVDLSPFAAELNNSDLAGGTDIVEVQRSLPGGGALTLRYRPSCNLLLAMTLSRGNARRIVELTELTLGASSASTAVAAREHYQSTDFADIGDNETDPFLRRMIILGYIEHGGSGFYDSSGRTLEGEHGHSH